MRTHACAAASQATRRACEDMFSFLISHEMAEKNPDLGTVDVSSSLCRAVNVGMRMRMRTCTQYI